MHVLNLISVARRKIWGKFRCRLLAYSPRKHQTSVAALNPEQRAVYEALVKTSSHALITGKAGTGKSVLLQYFAQHSGMRIIKVAPTGIAARIIQGQTIHSLFGFPSGVVNPKRLRVPAETRQILRHVDAVVIDEISMVRADVIDAISEALKIARDSRLAFGGAQLIAFGDPYQLPPVVAGNEMRHYFDKKYGGAYFFNAQAWSEAKPSVFELQKVVRQTGSAYKGLLNAVREGHSDPQILAELNRRVTPPEELPRSNFITLTSTNAAAQAINSVYLGKLKGKSHSFSARIIGEFEQSSMLAEAELNLKVGAQVMFLKNDPRGRWANGTIGTIKSITKREVKVRCGKKVYTVEPVEWEQFKYEYDEEADEMLREQVGSYCQIPLRLAWAITIHKSQGSTFSKVAIDLGQGAFAHGQTYVALSRCKALSGLYLLGEIQASDIVVDGKIAQFMHEYSTQVTS